MFGFALERKSQELLLARMLSKKGLKLPGSQLKAFLMQTRDLSVSSDAGTIHTSNPKPKYDFFKLQRSILYTQGPAGPRMVVTFAVYSPESSKLDPQSCLC